MQVPRENENKATQLSHPSFHQKNLENIKKHLLKNNYPVKLVDKLLKRPINLHNKEEQQTLGKYYEIPYSKILSENLAGVLRSDKVKLLSKAR
nr:unnamed protein product [Callosobruchus analis]